MSTSKRGTQAQLGTAGPVCCGHMKGRWCWALSPIQHHLRRPPPCSSHPPLPAPRKPSEAGTPPLSVPSDTSLGLCGFPGPSHPHSPELCGPLGLDPPRLDSPPRLRPPSRPPSLHNVVSITPKLFRARPGHGDAGEADWTGRGSEEGW